MEQSEPGRAWVELRKGLWRDNPVFVAVLGLCPAMAVTNSLANALVMGAATTFVLVGSSVVVSLLRKLIPYEVRTPLFIVVVATFVTSVDLALAALLPVAHRQLGAFIALIVANCLILGRQEAFASKHRVGLATADAIGMGLGFTLALALVGTVRELLGGGTLLGWPVFGPSFEPWVIMLLPPGGFFSLGALLIVSSMIAERRQRRGTHSAQWNAQGDAPGPLDLSPPGSRVGPE
ncbi:MAG: electron transport complex subunit RsxE [Myxococcales bacterium]|nr:electron transport complex subunit RsxE [Myxococcales bacterium]MDD9970977.1 electron transport complex subunit RsxE [Myxococcales bacterium]